jgi:DNA invertase Pin-like site-specific DNA recombinase
MIVGYVRVSTEDQDAERQQKTIEDNYDTDHVYADVEHGDVLTGRSGLDQLLTDAEDIDTVVVDELSRFGRTISVRDKIDQLRDHGVTIEVIDGGLTITPDPDDMDFASGLIYDFYTRQAQEELRQIRRRTREGIKMAREDGKHIGQVPRGYTTNDEGHLTVTDGTLQEYERVNEMIRLVNDGCPKKTAAKQVGLNPNSVASVLEKSDTYWDETYVGDEEWRRRNAEWWNEQ